MPLVICAFRLLKTNKNWVGSYLRIKSIAPLRWEETVVLVKINDKNPFIKLIVVIDAVIKAKEQFKGEMK